MHDNISTPLGGTQADAQTTDKTAPMCSADTPNFAVPQFLGKANLGSTNGEGMKEEIIISSSESAQNTHLATESNVKMRQAARILVQALLQNSHSE